MHNDGGIIRGTSLLSTETHYHYLHSYRNLFEVTGNKSTTESLPLIYGGEGGRVS